MKNIPKSFTMKQEQNHLPLKRALWLTVLNMLASIHFFWKLILSAFNWFKYDGTKFKDIEGEDTTIVYENTNAYDANLGRTYTDREDVNARSIEDLNK